MVFMNESGIVFTIMTAADALTGSPFMTLLMIFIILLLICLIMGIPLEFSAAFLMPFILVVWAYDSSFLAIGGVLLIYLGIVLAKNLPIGT